MANAQIHNWGRYILLAIVIIFGTGGWVFTVRDNTKDIGLLQVDVKDVRDDVHKLELSDKDIANLAQKSVDFMSRIDVSVGKILTEQTKLTAEQTKITTEQAVSLVCSVRILPTETSILDIKSTLF